MRGLLYAHSGGDEVLLYFGDHVLQSLGLLRLLLLEGLQLLPQLAVPNREKEGVLMIQTFAGW